MEGLPPPKGTFEPADSAGYRGTKTFEQVIMPHDATVKEIPALRFSFFDPETKRYETRATAPIAVSVTGSAASAAVAAPAVASTPPTPAAPDLVPNKVESGRTVATLRPIFLNPWFVAAQGLPLCALAGGLLFIRRQRRFAADPRLARASEAERAIHTRLEAMDQAVRQHASTGFFLAARGALQQRLGERWGVRPETITLAEINARLNGAGEGIRPVFEMADQDAQTAEHRLQLAVEQVTGLLVAGLVGEANALVPAHGHAVLRVRQVFGHQPEVHGMIGHLVQDALRGLLGLEEIPRPAALNAVYDLMWFRFLDILLHLDFTPPWVPPAENRHLAFETEDLPSVLRTE